MKFQAIWIRSGPMSGRWWTQLWPKWRKKNTKGTN